MVRKPKDFFSERIAELLFYPIISHCILGEQPTGLYGHCLIFSLVEMPFQMRVLILVVLLVPIIILIGWKWWLSDRMQLTFPIKNKLLVSSIEQFPISLEMINDTNFNAYLDLLRDQQSNRYMRDYIARIRFTDQGQ